MSFSALVFILLTYLFNHFFIKQEGIFSPYGKQTISGYAEIIDGDTIKIYNNRIRLKGIDAPELQQTCEKSGHKYFCGKESKSYLEKMTKNKIVTCDWQARDKYHRILGTCFVDDIIINRQMVLSGQAVNYYDYPREQKIAKEEKSGTWAGKFMRPQNWRRINK